MVKLHKLMIAVDGSASSMDAVRYVSRFFRPGDVSVTLIHVMGDLPEALEDLTRIDRSDLVAAEASKWRSRMIAETEKMMTSAQTLLIDAGYDSKAIDVNIRQRREGVARDIIAESENGYDAIFIGRRGADNPTDTIVGATAYRMMSGIKHLPVIVVGEKPDPDHVLIGFDGSDNAFAAVDCACRFMPLAGRKIQLCHVGQSMGSYLDGKSAISDDQANVLREQQRQQIGALMEDAAKKLALAGFDAMLVSNQIIEARVSRAVAIAKTAELEGFGTIVIGRRGLSVIKDFLMGRVSMKVLHRAHEMAVWIV